MSTTREDHRRERDGALSADDRRLTHDRPIPVSHPGRDFDIAAEIASLTEGRADIGAVVTFSGICRDEDGRAVALELEHYPGMAEAEIGRIADEAAERWPLAGLTVIHRYGKIKPGENIVLVVAASAHRQAAFEAANFLMDYLKTRAPFWKKEHRAGRSEGGWVEAKETDDEAAATLDKCAAAGSRNRTESSDTCAQSRHGRVDARRLATVIFCLAPLIFGGLLMPAPLRRGHRDRRRGRPIASASPCR